MCHWFVTKFISTRVEGVKPTVTATLCLSSCRKCKCASHPWTSFLFLLFIYLFIYLLIGTGNWTLPPAWQAGTAPLNRWAISPALDLVSWRGMEIVCQVVITFYNTMPWNRTKQVTLNCAEKSCVLSRQLHNNTETASHPSIYQCICILCEILQENVISTMPRACTEGEQIQLIPQLGGEGHIKMKPWIHTNTLRYMCTHEIITILGSVKKRSLE